MLSKDNRLYFIDFLKGIAMLGMILVHFNAVFNLPISALSKAASLGARCPQLFFIVSSFLTWVGFEKGYVKWGEFYKRRFIRIAPVYYFALIVCVFLPTVRLMDISAGNYISHILFLNGFVPEYSNSMLSVEWYIADLAIFYMLCPILKKAVKDLRSSVIAFLLSVCLSSLSLIAFNHFFYELIETDSANEMYFHTFCFVHQLPVILLGIMLYYFIKQADKKRIINTLIVSGIAVAVITVLFETLNLNKRFMTTSLIAGLAFAWIFLLCYSINNLFKKTIFRPLEFIGAHSFGIYCLHQVIINSFDKMSINKESITLWFICGVIIFALSILVGYLAEYSQKKDCRILQQKQKIIYNNRLCFSA